MKSLLLKLPLWVVIVGTIIAFVAINYLLGNLINRRIDVTEGQQFTLAPGSVALLESVEKPVTIRYYLSESDNLLPVELRNYAERVDDFLTTLQRRAPGKITLVRRDPQPDSDAEEEAKIDGLKGHPVARDASAYLGLSFTSLKKTVAIPFLNPEREDLLEFDVMTALRDVVTTGQKKAAVYSSLPTFGATGSFPPWALMDQLSRKFQVEVVQGTESRLPDELDLLIVIHPRNLSASFTGAVQTFLKNGGRLVVLCDSVAICQQFYQGRIGEDNAASDWPELLADLGYQFTPLQAVLDMRLKDQIDRGQGMETLNMVLHLRDEGIVKGHPITADVGGIKMPIAGAFKGQAADGWQVTTLLESTADSQLYPTTDLISLSKQTGEKTLNTFKADDQTYTLALLLEGKADAGSKDAAVLLLADADCASDPFAGSMVENQGRLEFQPSSGNFGFLFNAIDFMTGGVSLNEARNRQQARRPLTRLVELRREAEEKYRDKIAELEQRRTELEEAGNAGRLGAGMDATGESLGSGGMSRVQALREERIAVNRELRQTRHQLRQNLRAVESRLKWINIGLIPALVVLTGIVVIWRRAHHSRART